MAQFKCQLCKHNRSSNPSPLFPEVKEQDAKLTQEQHKQDKKEGYLLLSQKN